MASSQPIDGSVGKKGQAAMMCELCEQNAKLKWKCLECELMMCQRCRDKVHQKFASAQDHTIIDIKIISNQQTDSEPKPDLTRIKCGIHSEHNCCLYCTTCQELVCPTCNTKTHNEHKFNDISEEYNIKMAKIRNGQKNIEKEMQILVVSEQTLKQIKFDEQSNYAKVKQEILDYNKALKNDIQKHTDKLLNELDQKWKAVTQHIGYEEKQLIKQQGQIQKQAQEINTLLLQSNVKNVISVSDSLLKSLETNVSPVITLFIGVPKFTHGDKIKIPLILGNLDIGNPHNTELQVDNQFETDLEGITSVVCCPYGSFWICDSISDIVQKVKPQSDVISVISNLKMKVHDAALLPSGDLLLADEEASNLKLVPSGSTDIRDSVYTVSPIYPTGINVSRDNKIMIGAADAYDIPATGPRQVRQDIMRKFSNMTEIINLYLLIHVM